MAVARKKPAADRRFDPYQSHRLFNSTYGFLSWLLCKPYNNSRTVDEANNRVLLVTRMCLGGLDFVTLCRSLEAARVANQPAPWQYKRFGKANDGSS